MNDAVVGALEVDRFVADHLSPGRPVLVRQAFAAWGTPAPWDLAWLTERFGDYRVPLYDTLFALNGLSTFQHYVRTHTGAAVTGVPPYLRWFVRQSTATMPWADKAFAELAGDWTMPSWLPAEDYAFPRLRRADATRDAFPAKGLFVCGRGGRTRLHTDPWVSDACLCQVTGAKRMIMYAPDAAGMLTRDGAVVDLDRPDDDRFPRWRDATAVFDEVLEPGDAVFIPAGWFHTAIALSDSVSITWNFVHDIHRSRFQRYLDAGGATDATVAYFRSRSGG